MSRMHRGLWRLHKTAVAVLAVVVVLGCDARSAPAPASAGTSRVAGTLDSLASRDVELANLAAVRALSPEVRVLAGSILQTRSHDLSELRGWIERDRLIPSFDDRSAELRARSEQAASGLSPLRGSDFDRAWVDQVITNLREALLLLAVELIPEAAEPFRTKLDQGTRPALQARLDEAHALKVKLASLTTLTDPRLAALIDAVSHEHVRRAREVGLATRSVAVQGLARRMIQDHEHVRKTLANTMSKLRLTQASEVPLDELLVELRSHGRALELARGSQLDWQYSATLQKELTRQLEELDSRWLPATQSPELAGALRSVVRPMLHSELSFARLVQRSMLGSARTHAPRPRPAF